VTLHPKKITLATLKIHNNLKIQLREAQDNDQNFRKLSSEISKGVGKGFKISEDGLIMFNKIFCVPNNPILKTQILEEAHKSRYLIHPGINKMFQDVKKQF
jgi:hypothetical protein